MRFALRLAHASSFQDLTNAEAELRSAGIIGRLVLEDETRRLRFELASLDTALRAKGVGHNARDGIENPDAPLLDVSTAILFISFFVLHCTPLKG